MTKKILAILTEKGGYWAWTNSETEPLRRLYDLCLNCQGACGGTDDGCPAERQLMELCAENDLRVAVSGCPVWQPSSGNRVAVERRRADGLDVAASTALEAVREDQCLCLNCQKYCPGKRQQCYLAEAMSRVSRRSGLALVTCRCPEWEPKK